MFSLRRPRTPFYSKDFLDALLELDLQEDLTKLYKGSLDTLMLKVEGDRLLPVGDKKYVDYRALYDKKRNVFDILNESEYKNLCIDSVRFDEIKVLKEKTIGSGFSFELKKGDVSVLLEVPKTYEEYLSNLSKKNRHELKRKINKFNNEFPEHEVSSGNDQSHFSSFINLHKKSSKEKKEFMTQRVEIFFNRLLTIKGWRVYLLKVNKKVVASCFCFESKEALYLYNSGKNIDFNDYSVGIFLTNHLIMKSINEKKKIFDFLKGDERYKFDLGGKAEQLYDIELNKI